MPRVNDRDELWALALLQQIIDRSNEKRDALSGQAVGHIKEAVRIFKKRQQYKRDKHNQ